MEPENGNTMETPDDAEKLRIIRRRNQNRIAQMLHRKRKDQTIESLQARISLSEKANEQHVVQQRILNKRIHQLEKDNAEMRAFITSLSSPPSAGLSASPTGQIAGLAPPGWNHSSLPLCQWETQIQSSALSEAGYPQSLDLHSNGPSQTQGSRWSEASLASARSQDNRSEETINVSEENYPSALHQAAADGRASMSNEVNLTQHPCELLGGSDSISLAQAALIIQDAFADTLEHTDNVCAYDERAHDIPISDPSTLKSVSSESWSGGPFDAPSTFDVVRLVRDHHFDFINDLSCPIFQTIIMASTGQGHVTVPVLGEDGNALTSSELWNHLRGSCKFEDSLDLHLLCDGLRQQIAGRQSQSLGRCGCVSTLGSLAFDRLAPDIHIKDIDDVVNQLWIARHFAEPLV